MLPGCFTGEETEAESSYLGLRTYCVPRAAGFVSVHSHDGSLQWVQRHPHFTDAEPEAQRREEPT